MYLLGIALLLISTWYLIKLYDNFNNDKIAKKEIIGIWQDIKNDLKAKNPFASGRIKDAIKSYKSDMKKNLLDEKTKNKNTN